MAKKTADGMAPPARHAPPKSKAAQGRLPGFTPRRIVEIEEAANALKEVRDRRMSLTEQEIELADGLVRIMKKHEVPVYRLDDEFDVKLKPGKDKVSITRVKEEKAGQEKESED